MGIDVGGRRLPRLGRQAGEDFAVEVGVGLPGLAGDEAAVADGLLVYEGSSGLLGFEADVFVAGDAFAVGSAGGGEDLDAVADGEDPLLLGVEFADDLEEALVVAEVLGGAAAEDEDGVVVGYIDLVEGDVGGEAVAGALDVGVPAWLEVVHDEVEAADGWGGNGGLPVCLLKAMHGVEGFVGFAGVSGSDEYLWHKCWPVYHSDDAVGWKGLGPGSVLFGAAGLDCEVIVDWGHWMKVGIVNDSKAAAEFDDDFSLVEFCW